MVLERNVPTYTLVAKSTDKTRHITVLPESQHQFVSKTKGGTVIPNIRAKTSMSDNNRAVILPNSLTVGGFSGSGTIPNSDRVSQRSSNYSTGKTGISQNITSIMSDRSM